MMVFNYLYLFYLELLMISQNRKNWNDFQDKAIVTLVKRYGTKNWAEISQRMSSKYGIDYRSGKQCRQRWHNHLDPSINKQSWTDRQQKLMFESHQKYGNKWTEIAKLFHGRTDNDIKNHFYSMLRRSLRRINKLLGKRNSTQRIKVIKPSVLSKIFVNIGVKDQRKSLQCKKISEALYQFSKAKPDNQLSESLDFQEKGRLEGLIQRLCRYKQKLSYLSDQYEHSQLIRRQSLKSKTSNVSRQNSGNLEQIPHITKNTSKLSSVSTKSKKIQRVVRRKASKAVSEPEQIEVPQSSKRKVSRKLSKQKSFKEQGKKTIDSLDKIEEERPEIKIQEKSMDIEKGYNTRLRKNQSVISERPLIEELALPDFLQNPDHLTKKSSSMSSSLRLRSSNSNIFFHSPGFVSNNTTNSNLFIGPSPRAPFRNWTPLCPSPNMGGDIFSRGNYDFKTNNEDLDNVMNELKRKIEENT